jgi:EF hand
VAAPAAANASFNPRAVELFQRDWVLNQWAKRAFDANGDGVISVEEAQPAALRFKEIADGDGDGRVTPYEYDRARELILARY